MSKFQDMMDAGMTYDEVKAYFDNKKAESTRPRNEHEYDMSKNSPQNHRLDKAVGNQLICTMPGHHDSMFIKSTQVPVDDGKGGIKLVDMAPR